MRRFSSLILLAVLAAGIFSCSGPVTGEHRDGYTVSRVMVCDSIPAFLLVPDGASASHPAPAVLMLHDHGARFDIGKEKLVRPLASAPDHIKASADQWIHTNFEGVYVGDSLCSLGYVVLVPDALYWGERSNPLAQTWSELSFGPQADQYKDSIKVLKNVVYEGQRDVYASCVRKQGKEWAYVMMEDDRAAMEWLAAQPYVDAGRIGSFGFSMGAHRSWFLAANTDGLRCAVAQNWMTSLAAADTTSASSRSMSTKLRESMDIPEIAAMASPTPMLVLAGERDHLFPRDTVARCFDVMHSTYAPGALRTEFFDGAHECPKRVQAIIVSYLDSQLKD